jgi:(1->4)-alpha-D-glucan 1-alpha-D-glucosylmutase
MTTVDRDLEICNQIVDDVFRELDGRRVTRGSTYRFQFNQHFTFRHATSLVPYLKELGITHVYASPFLKAQAGSGHGYDVTDHNSLNPELGTEEDYRDYIRTLKEHGLGQILDMVPNHMAASSANAWWNDLLENGPNSPYANYFDVDWRPVKGELANKVLLPILGQQYGEALEAGQLQLEHADGGFFLRYFDNVLPIGPETSIPVLVHRIDELRQALGESSEAFLEYQSIITALQHLPPQSATEMQQTLERQREKEVIKRRLRVLESEQPLVVEFIQRNLLEFNGRPGDPHSFDRLDSLLTSQAYRLSHWKAASDEVNYRRFFDVNGLAAVCMEVAEVFRETHRLVFELLARGDIDGLRIDHIDGLYDPAQYLWRLQWSYLDKLGERAFQSRQENRERGSKVERHSSEAVSAPSLAAMGVTTDSPGTTFSEPTFTPPSAAEQEAGLVGGAAAAGEASTHLSPENVSAEAPLQWSDVRERVLTELCQRLEMPRPDDAILGRKTEVSDDQGRLVPEPAPTDAYTRSQAGRRDYPLYVAVEKILGPDEPLPMNWPVAGTSGYDFLHQLNGLYLEKEGVAAMKQTYLRFTGETGDFSEIVYRCKMLILRVAMSSELQMLAHRINRISEQHRRSRDFTLNTLRHALREILALFPVYRTYPSPAGVSERDRRFVHQAVGQAKRRNPAIDAAVFDFIRNILLLEHPDGIPDEAKRERELFAGRFQQVTSPVMAKGVEDTTFYQYMPLLSSNEVGCHPETAVVSVEHFHRDNLDRRRNWPKAMTTTTTHDTKRSEDVRARINVLCEVPHLWRKAVNQWSRLNRRFHREVDGQRAPSHNDEWLFYQTLVGMWPTTPPKPEEYGDLIGRLQNYMEKATREAKLRTSWINPNVAYDEAMREFVAAVLSPQHNKKFLAEFQRFQELVVDWGMYTALSQLVVRLMSPGIPDVYQGQEAWDFSLVDPDNRRPVDYQSRQNWLNELCERSGANEESQRVLAGELARTPRDPRLKVYATSRLLHLRRNEPQLFEEGEYVPLEVQGAAAAHLCAFAWRRDTSSGCRAVIVVAPRFIAKLAGVATEPHRSVTNPALWENTSVILPNLPEEGWKNCFTGVSGMRLGQHFAVADQLTAFPAVVLSNCS